MLRSTLLLGLGMFLVGACGSNVAPPFSSTAAAVGGGGQCATGAEGCSCYANNSCNGSLSCFSALCVNAGVGGSASSAGGSTGGATNAAGADTGSTNAGGMSAAGTNAGGMGDAGSSAAGTSAGGTSAGGMGDGGSSTAGTSAGGTSAGGTSAGGTSAGSTSAGGTSAGGTGAAGSGGSPPSIYLIDDFADCDAQIIQVDGRTGHWFDLSTILQTFKVGTPPSSSWLDQSCGVFLTGSCSTCATAGIGVILAPGTYDLSRFSGIRVTYESESTLYIRVKATNGSSYTYATSGAVVPSAGESVATVLFSSMTQDVGFQGFAKADEIHFTISNKASFGIGIHRLELLP